jgi:putative transcriptional regulator
MDSLTGHLLVASRYLRDPNFYRTVVLMVQHNEQGALGLVLNRPGDKSIADIWSQTGHEACNNPALIHVGGPVPGPLMAVHTIQDIAESEILPGLYFATHRDSLDRLVRQEEPFRLFAGHSGWGAEQLEGELKVGGWLTTRATLEDVWCEPANVWKDVTQRIGLEIIAPDIDPKHVPKDPNWN